MDYVNELLNGNLKRISKQKKSFPNIHRRGKALAFSLNIRHHYSRNCTGIVLSCSSDLP